MFLGVRVGGEALLPAPFRWGFGWPVLLGYRELTADEELHVKALTPAELPL